MVLKMNVKVPPFSLFTSVAQPGRFPTSTVVRIFGIFTHAEIKRKRFWDILSQQLQQRGQDYIDRCTFRNKPLNVDDDIILPAVFPPSTEWVRDVEGSSSLGKVSEEDMKEVGDILACFEQGG